MTDVIIIGGGLTGLSAAWELENLGISDYTLIEVKPRLGGAILTEKCDGFIMDGSAFVIEKYGAWDFLDPLGLSDAIRHVGRYRDGRLAIFKDGTQTLVDAIAAKLTRPPMFRMAVNSIGKLDKTHYGVCLENGLMLTAKAVIVTAPARYAAHILYSLNPQAGLLLDGYAYEQVARVHLGYRKADIEPNPREGDQGDGLDIKYIEGYDYPERVPQDCVLIRAGVRVTPTMPKDKQALAEMLINGVKRRLVTRADPLVAWTHYWTEADPLTRHLPEHLTTMHQLETLLPSTVVIAGSDYRAKRLDQQVTDGQAAAQKIKLALTAVG